MVDNSYFLNSPSDEMTEPIMDLCAINTQDLLPLQQSFTDPEQFVELPQQGENRHSHTVVPEHWFKYPNLEKVHSDFNFNVLFHRGDSQNWMYSPHLEKVYIKMHSVMNVSVSFKPVGNSMNFFVRAMIVYSSPDDMHREVNRCLNHIVPSDKNQHVPPSHILKCYHPNTHYQGEQTKQLFGERLSLVVPLETSKIDEDGLRTESIGLEFLCQSSCPTGINRKAAAIVFTLENFACEILGKRVINFKVCSCPKRDMAKDSENIFPKKRDASNEPSSKGKRPNKMVKIETEVKIEPPASVSPVLNVMVQSPPQPPQSPIINQDESVTVTLTMPTQNSMAHVLRCAFNECTGLMARDSSNRQFIKYAHKIKRLMEIYSEEP